MGLQQHVDVPTHKSGHTLDLIITRRADSLLTDPMADYLFSDHFLVISDLITEPVKKPSVTVKRYRTLRKTKHVNNDLFTNDMRKSALCQHCPDSLLEVVDLYNTHYQTLLIYTLLLSPRPSNHSHLSHGTVWRSKRQEESDGNKAEKNGVAPDVALIC